MLKLSSDYEFVNKILLVWAKYMSYAVTRLDDHVSMALRGMTNKERASLENAKPLGIYY